VPFDPRNGVMPDMTPYGTGATAAAPVSQPTATARIARAEFSWQGGGQGLDRPLDRPFVAIEHRAGRQWRRVTDDLGLEIVWRVDDKGIYTALWQVPFAATLGKYRFVVTANRYKLVSQPFRVVRSRALTLSGTGRSGSKDVVAVGYPPVDVLQDLTARPRRARPPLLVAPGTTLRAGTVRDRYGNVNGQPFTAQK
jgi:hypothetical protein